MMDSFDMHAVEQAEFAEILQFREESNNRVTLPKKLKKNGVVHVDDTVTWFIDTVQDLAFISAQPEPWESDDRFVKVAASKVTDQRVTNVPKQFFKDYVGPNGSSIQGSLAAVAEKHRLEYDHLYYLLAPEICFVETPSTESYGVYLVPVEEYVALKGKSIAEFHAGKSVDQYLNDGTTDLDDDPDPPGTAAA